MSVASSVDPAPAAVVPGTLEVDKFDFAYGSNHVLHEVSVSMAPGRVTAFIGPSGCGKSTLLRCINRINDIVPSARVLGGTIRLSGVDLYHPDLDVIKLRRRVGMVFQKYNPFPMSIFDNVAYGLSVAGVRDRAEIGQRVEDSLVAASLWDEVKDRLTESALGLSGGQQQRLCIARTLAVRPSAILMDEPCSALDPIATAHIEELIHQLREKYTIIIVTHNMEQARRVADDTAFFLLGRLIEFRPTMDLFTEPEKPETERYVTGQMG